MDSGHSNRALLSGRSPRSKWTVNGDHFEENDFHGKVDVGQFEMGSDHFKIHSDHLKWTISAVKWAMTSSKPTLKLAAVI